MGVNHHGATYSSFFFPWCQFIVYINPHESNPPPLKNVYLRGVEASSICISRSRNLLIQNYCLGQGEGVYLSSPLLLIHFRGPELWKLPKPLVLVHFEVGPVGIPPASCIDPPLVRIHFYCGCQYYLFETKDWNQWWVIVWLRLSQNIPWEHATLEE